MTGQPDRAVLNYSFQHDLTPGQALDRVADAIKAAETLMPAEIKVSVSRTLGEPWVVRIEWQ